MSDKKYSLRSAKDDETSKEKFVRGYLQKKSFIQDGKNARDERDVYSELINEANSILSNKGELNYFEKGKAAAIANDLIKKAYKDRNAQSAGNTSLIKRGMALYEKAGKGNKPLLLNKLKAIAKDDKTLFDWQKKEIRKYVEKHSSEEQEKGLAGKVMNVIGSIALLGSLFFLYPNLTGNIIGNMNSSGSNWIGAILFILGLGLFVLESKI